MRCHAHRCIRPRRVALALLSCATDVPNQFVPGSQSGTAAPGQPPLPGATLLPLVCASLAWASPTQRRSRALSSFHGPGLVSPGPQRESELRSTEPVTRAAARSLPAAGNLWFPCRTPEPGHLSSLYAHPRPVPRQVRRHCSHRTCDPGAESQASLVTCGSVPGVTARPTRHAAGSNLCHCGYGRSPGLPERGNHMFPARGVKQARPAATLGAGDRCRRDCSDEGRNS